MNPSPDYPWRPVNNPRNTSSSPSTPSFIGENHRRLSEATALPLKSELGGTSIGAAGWSGSGNTCRLNSRIARVCRSTASVMSRSANQLPFLRRPLGRFRDLEDDVAQGVWARSRAERNVPTPYGNANGLHAARARSISSGASTPVGIRSVDGELGNATRSSAADPSSHSAFSKEMTRSGRGAPMLFRMRGPPVPLPRGGRRRPRSPQWCRR